MRRLGQLLVFVNPIVIYIAVIYGITRVVERAFSFENFWDNVWREIVTVLGENDVLYAVWLPNLLVTLMTLPLGLMLHWLEGNGKLRRLEKFKIHKSKIVNHKVDVFKVRPANFQQINE
jgi:hypothetical protein